MSKKQNILIPLNKEQLSRLGREDWREGYAYMYAENRALLVYLKENAFRIMGYENCRSTHIAKTLHSLLQYKKQPLSILLGDCPLYLEANMELEVIFDFIVRIERLQLSDKDI